MKYESIFWNTPKLALTNGSAYACVLVQNHLVYINLVHQLFGIYVMWLWEMMKPMVEGARKQFKVPKSLEWLEYLYNEIRKRGGD